ncbi:MAG: N-acetylmuramoyl-L-alanine amidase [candidate division KSB1 bacterium]|nr:N-acetylmuramoyl-L-alanine amidase [candidate division KSB1 bacterium]
MAKTAHDLVLRTGFRNSYYFFLPKDVRLQIIGEYLGTYNVRLSRNTTAWIDTSGLIPLNTHAPLLSAVIKNVRITEDKKYWNIKVYTHLRVPFRIEQSVNPQALDIYFYYSTADTDWMRNLCNKPQRVQPQWQQVNDGLYRLHIPISVNQQWGYKTEYDKDDNFVIRIKKPPRIAKWPYSPLKHLHILLDPGHWPDHGAVGPSGVTEKEINLRLARELAERLRQKGATVSLTHNGEPGISLQDRIRYAKELEPDILLSLHHNALPDGVNPFINHGTSTYYYHPQNFALALKIQEQLLDTFHLPNYGLFWDNLAMCRITNTISVLIEPAFMIYPQEEKLVRSKAYYRECSKALIQSIREFITD